MYLLDLDDILDIHKSVIADFGGSEDYYNNTLGKVESIISQQYPHFGIDKYPSIFQKSAMLLYFLIKGHCFVDGNKRVGAQSCISMLYVNGYFLKVTENLFYDKCISIATIDPLTIDLDRYLLDLSRWLKNYCTT